MSFKKIIPAKAIDSICLNPISTVNTIIVLISIFVLTNQQKTIAQCHIDDWTALKALYESTNGDFWTNRTGWDVVIDNQVTPPVNCNLEDLFGVHLDGTGRVECLDLDGNDDCVIRWSGEIGNNLTGVLPPEIGYLTNLKEMYLRNNGLIGSIPSELVNLSNLITLIMSHNQLSGSLSPELSNLTSLVTFEIDNNSLSGCYPYSLNTFLCEQINDKSRVWHISQGNNFDGSMPESCPLTEDVTGSCPQECNVYPGDLNNDGIVDNQDASLHGLYLYNVGLARAFEHQNTDWSPHPSQEWGIVNNQNKDLKYHDCNGDGIIDGQDWQAIQDNMGQMWRTTLSIDPPDESDYQVMLQPTDQIYDGYLVMNVSLERRAGGNLTVQAGYFTVDYSEVEGEIINAALSLDTISWLGSLDINLFVEKTTFLDDKKIEVGFTKTDNASSTGSGPIGKLVLQYDNSASKRAGDSNISNQFKVNTIGIHQNSSNFMLVEDQQLQVNLTSVCQPNWTISNATPFQNLYKSTGNITTNSFVLVGTGQEIEYRGNRITLNSGFKVKAGASFKARHGSCHLSGNGLLAIYYNNMDFTGNSISRIDAAIDFNWGSGSPDNAIEGNTFSTRWEGFVKAPASGSYTFYATTDDGVRLWINNQLIIDRWVNQPATEISGIIQMSAGQKVPIKMEYYENTGGAVAQLRWEGPGTAKQIIPNNYLFLN